MRSDIKIGAYQRENRTVMRFHLLGFHVVKSADDIITRKVLIGYVFLEKTHKCLHIQNASDFVLNGISLTII